MAALINLLAHETVHEYALLGHHDGIEADVWYLEGSAKYYAALLGRGTDAAARLRDLNDAAQAYYTERELRTNFSYVLAHYQDNIFLTRVAYRRGFAYFAHLQGLIARATGGARGVDDLVLELYRRRTAGKPCDVA